MQRSFLHVCNKGSIAINEAKWPPCFSVFDYRGGRSDIIMSGTILSFNVVATHGFSIDIIVLQKVNE